MRAENGSLEIEDFFLRSEFRSHFSILTDQVLTFAYEERLALQLWIAHADTSYLAANFKTINDFLRVAHLTARPSPFTWAAYVAQ
jgi:hypothetical protein